MHEPIDLARLPTSRAPGFARWKGRAFGGILLAAFLLYGVGSATSDRPIGLLLVAANSIAVALAGWIGLRLVGVVDRRVGSAYLVARLAEAVLLVGGILLTELADIGGADNDGYLLAMVALAAGSIPFCRTLGQQRLIPRALALWGICGYAALGVGGRIR